MESMECHVDAGGGVRRHNVLCGELTASEEMLLCADEAEFR